jgi:hypothetical protein
MSNKNAPAGELRPQPHDLQGQAPVWRNQEGVVYLSRYVDYLRLFSDPALRLSTSRAPPVRRVRLVRC